MIFAMKGRLLSDQVLGKDLQTSKIECLSQCWVFFSLYVSLPRLAACFIFLLISHLLFDGHYSRRWERSTERNKIPALMKLTWQNRKSGKGSWGGCQIQDGWSEEVSLKWHWSKDLQVTREWRLTTWGVKERVLKPEGQSERNAGDCLNKEVYDPKEVREAWGQMVWNSGSQSVVQEPWGFPHFQEIQEIKTSFIIILRCYLFLFTIVLSLIYNEVFQRLYGVWYCHRVNAETDKRNQLSSITLSQTVKCFAKCTTVPLLLLLFFLWENIAIFHKNVTYGNRW